MRLINFPKKSRFFHQLSLLTPSFCVKRNGIAESIGEPMMDSATPDRKVLCAEWHVGWPSVNSRPLGFVRFINFPKNSDFPMNALCWPRHSERSEVVESIGGPMMDSATPDKDVLRAEWQDGWLTMNLRTLSFVRLINFPKNPDFPSNALCSPRILSVAKSQNLIVILREAKWNRRIYLRTDDGFCNFGQRCPPCRMTWSTADNEFKDSKFCEIDQFPKKFRFSY